MIINRLSSYKKTFEKIVFFSLCFLFVFPILPHAVQSIAIVVLLMFSVLTYGATIRCNIKKLSIKPFLFLCGWFLFLTLTLIYTQDFNEGIKRISRGVNFLIFPFIFFYILPDFSLKKKNVLNNIFILTHLFLFCFLFYKAIEGIDKIGYRGPDGKLVKGLLDENIFKQIVTVLQMPFYLSRYYINENNISTFFTHKVYLSMGFVWSVFLIAHKILNNNLGLIKKTLWSVLAMLFILAVIYFTSLPNLLVLLLLPIFIFLNLKKSIYKGAMVAVVLFFGLFAVNNDAIYNKVFNDVRLKTDIVEAKNMVLSICKDKPYEEGANIRLEVWRCAYQKISDAWLMGYGIGDEENILHECYIEKACENCLGLNSHNYYASLLLMGGILVFGLFILSIICSLKLAIDTKNYLLIVFILLVTINLLSENLFVRIHGVLFYSIIGSYMMAISLNKNHQLEKR